MKKKKIELDKSIEQINDKILKYSQKKIKVN
jgi:hypothetical protein